MKFALHDDCKNHMHLTNTSLVKIATKRNVHPISVNYKVINHSSHFSGAHVLANGPHLIWFVFI